METKPNPPVAMQIDFVSGFGGNPVRTQYLFADLALATAVFDTLKDATERYHNRANDRERMVRFDHLTGCAAVDVSCVAAIGIANELGEARAAVEAWNTGCAEIRGLSDRVEAAAKAGGVS